MPHAETGKAVQLLDLVLEFFADDDHWARGCYNDGNGGRCLVGALLHVGRQHSLPTAPAIALLQDAMPRPGLPLVHFNDTRCGSIAELRSIILKARRLADDVAERERAATAAKNWLLAPGREKPSRNRGGYRRNGTGRAVTARTPCRLASAFGQRSTGHNRDTNFSVLPYVTDIFGVPKGTRRHLHFQWFTFANRDNGAIETQKLFSAFANLKTAAVTASG